MSFFVLGFPFAAQAGVMMKTWQLKETATAPILVVGRVAAVHKNQRVPDGSLPWQAETWSMTADVDVLRSYNASEKTAPVNRVQVQFLAYGPSITTFINGYPPPLPNPEPGQVLIFPLRETRSAGSEEWHLTADSGAALLIPALADSTDDTQPPPASARAFLIRELASTLSRGTPPDVSRVSGYLSRQDEDLSRELLPLLEPVIGDDRHRWAEIAANLIGAQGTPRPGISVLLSANEGVLRGNMSLAQAALRKLKASPETDELLIRTWIADAPLNAWGSANSLLEFAHDPVTLTALRQALRDDLTGSSYIAYVLAQAGENSFLPEALSRALRVADRPDVQASGFDDLQGAAALVRDYGSDRDLTELAALVRKYQTLAPKFYSSLWQCATESGNPREARVLAVVLTDRRISFGDTRYCDFALGVLEKAVGQHFRGSGDTLQERDEAVSRGLAWIKAQGLAN